MVTPSPTNSVFNRPLFGVANVAGVIPSAETPPIDLEQGIAPMGAGATQQATGRALRQVAGATAPPPWKTSVPDGLEYPEQFISSREDDGMPNISSENMIPYMKSLGMMVTPDEEKLFQLYEGQTKPLDEWETILSQADETGDAGAAVPKPAQLTKVADKKGLGEDPFNNLGNVLNTTAGQTQVAEVSAKALKQAASPEAPPAAGGIEGILAQSLKNTPIKTPEEYNEDAKKILGAEGEKDVPDWALPLMQFGLALMSTPGPVTQAIGIAGQKALPAFAAARKEKRIRKKEQGLLAYKLREADVASQKSTRVALATHLSGQQTLAVNLLGKITTGIKNQLDAVPEHLRGIIVNAMKTPTYKGVLKQIRGGDIGLALESGENAVQLAISDLIDAGKIKKKDLGGFQDRGWKARTILVGDKQATFMVATKPVSGINANLEKGILEGGVGEKKRISPLSPRAQAPGSVMMIQRDANGGLSIVSATGTPENISRQIGNARGEKLQEQEIDSFQLVSDASDVVKILGEVGTAGLSFPVGPGGKALAIGSDLLTTLFPGSKDVVDDIKSAWVTAFYGTPEEDRKAPTLAQKINKYSTNDHSVARDNDSGIWLGGARQKSRHTAGIHIQGLNAEKAESIIASGANDPDTAFESQEDKDAFIKFASAPSELRSLLYDMAYAVARAAEPGGRLTDRDIANALTQLGYNNNSFVSADIFKRVLTSKVRRVVNRYGAVMRQHNLASLSPEEMKAEREKRTAQYNAQVRYELITKRPWPVWMNDPSAAESEAESAAGPPPAIVKSEPGMSGVDRSVDISASLIRRAVVSSPVFSTVDDPEEKSTLAETFPPYLLNEMINKQGNFRLQEDPTKNVSSVLQSLTQVPDDIPRAQKLKKFQAIIMEEEGVGEREAKKLAKRYLLNLKKLYGTDILPEVQGRLKEYQTGLY